MKGWALAAVLACLLFATFVRYKQQGDEGGALLRAARYSLDSLKNQSAQKLIADERANDSLRLIIARYKASAPRVLIKHDTAYVPAREWIFVTDTLIPECERCTERSDSLRALFAAQQRASDFLIDGLQRENAGMRRRHARQKLLSRFGLFVGYGATREPGGTLRGGWQLGVGARLWP